MSRRPHWDDDLIDAVFRALSHTYRAQGWTGGIAIDLDESVYPLIAAVEDWQAEKRRGEAAFSWLMARDARQEAAIQRVRELHTPYRIMLGSVPTDTNCNGCNRTYPCPTIRALDGDGDE